MKPAYFSWIQREVNMCQGGSGDVVMFGHHLAGSEYFAESTALRVFYEIIRFHIFCLKIPLRYCNSFRNILSAATDPEKLLSDCDIKLMVISKVAQ